MTFSFFSFYCGNLIFEKVAKDVIIIVANSVMAAVVTLFAVSGVRMAKEWAKAFYNSKRWQQCRDSYVSQRIITDGGECEICGISQGYIVHHKTALTESNIGNPDISLSHDNLQYVCKDCHDKIEGHGVGNKKIKPLFAFDAEGQPISLREIDNSPRPDVP